MATPPDDFSPYTSTSTEPGMRAGRSPGGPFKVGQTFGPYVLENYLGSGAFKSVYRARRKVADPQIPDLVALGFPHQQDEAGISEVTKESLLPTEKTMLAIENVPR